MNVAPLSSSLSSWRAGASAPAASAMGLRAAGSLSQDTAISILTAEGDRVTLSASLSVDAEFSTYDARGRLGGCASCSSDSGMQFSLSRESSFSLQVEGDLSREEIHDIRKAVKTIEKATRDLAKGDVEGAVKRAAKLQNLESISELNAEIQITREVAVEQWSATESEPTGAEPAPAPLRFPAWTAPAAAGTAEGGENAIEKLVGGAPKIEPEDDDHTDKAERHCGGLRFASCG